MNKGHIYLIGMMGSWKSTVGRKLAKRIELPFCDIDTMVEERLHMSIAQIFKHLGEKRFREVETQIMCGISTLPPSIVATGGGLALAENNRRIMGDTGFIVQLNADTDTLAERIKSTRHRPLLWNQESIPQKLEEIWQERKLIYDECADTTIKTDNHTVDEIVAQIHQYLIEIHYVSN